MSRPLTLVLLLLFASLLLQSAPAPRAAAQAPAATEKVNCRRGESVNKALAKQPGAVALVVEIDGVCHENVVVTRDRVRCAAPTPPRTPSTPPPTSSRWTPRCGCAARSSSTSRT